jgi:hypothetical protein
MQKLADDWSKRREIEISTSSFIKPNRFHTPTVLADYPVQTLVACRYAFALEPPGNTVEPAHSISSLKTGLIFAGKTSSVWLRLKGEWHFYPKKPVLSEVSHPALQFKNLRLKCMYYFVLSSLSSPDLAYPITAREGLETGTSVAKIHDHHSFFVKFFIFPILNQIYLVTRALIEYLITFAPYFFKFIIQ